MHSLRELREALSSRGLAPRKALGQCFLIDANLAAKLLDRAGVGAGDVALEVGPGAGALTEGLLERGCVVVACEVDRGLCALLRDRFGQAIASGQLRLVEGGCLDAAGGLNSEARAALGEGPWRLVANLPYNVGTPLLMTLLVDEPACAAMCVTVQKEVAQRLQAGPSTKAYGAVSVVTQALAQVETIATLGPRCFWPSPKVESRMLAIERRSAPLTDDPQALAEAARRLFQRRRKQLRSAVPLAVLERAGIDPSARPEQLPVEAFVALAEAIKAAQACGAGGVDPPG